MTRRSARPSEAPGPAVSESAAFPGPLQPARVALHVGFGVVPLLYWALDIPRASMLAAVLGATAGFVGLDAARLMWPAWNRRSFAMLGPFLRSREVRRLTGASYSLVALGVAVAVFPPAGVAAGFLYHSVGDPVASWAGRRFGRHRVGAKSLEGTAAFIVAGALASWFVVGGGPAVVGAAAAGAAELWLPVDDNLSVPLVGGAAAWLVTTGA